MKLKVSQRKQSKKAYKLFRIVHMLAPPYRVFIDDSCLEMCASLQVNDPRECLSSLLSTLGYRGSITLCTHKLVLDKLRNDKKLDALKIGQKLLYVTVKRPHAGQSDAQMKIEDVCTAWVLSNEHAHSDRKNCIVATNSETVVKALQAFPHVPTIHMNHKSKCFVFDEFKKKMGETEKKQPAVQGRKKRAHGVNPLSNMPKRKKLSLQESYGK
ncbi:hypothetical protein XU18_5152 [Perkinsela sp. CCAP 1560/4]|nr:hypothetical protein XU18_5152 [Perkinsela sp. CCAP 1560/4]|eukprot:KNH01784.1 hypothetical protein XU18_5152 [Perkinsela sp. CCAP 1560/4]